MSMINHDHLIHSIERLITMKTNQIPIEQRLAGLVDDCETWEQTELSSCNDVLYGLLTRCYEVCRDVTGKPSKIKVVDAVVTTRNIKVQSNTPLMTKIVKIVFGAERKRASTYSLALRLAYEQKIAPEKLRDFFFDAGGVEEVRLQASGTKISAVSREQREDFAIETLSVAQPLAIISKSDRTPELDMDDTNHFVVLLGEISANGDVKVLEFVPDKALKSQALRVIGAVREKAMKSAEDSKAQASKEQVKRETVEDAAADAASGDAGNRHAA